MTMFFSKTGALYALLMALISLSVYVEAAEEQRAPPVARTAGTLSDSVQRAILAVQELMSPEEGEPDFEQAKEQLDELRERRYERMSAYERATTLNFYTTYYLNTEQIPEAISTFEEMLSLEELAESTRQRSLLALGQLNLAEENFEDSIRNYELWREFSLEEKDTVFQGLAYSHYQLDQFSQALPYWLQYLELNLQQGMDLSRDEYVFLNSLYLGMEDFENAVEVTKSMIVLFNDPADWRYLTAIYSNLDDEDRRIKTLEMAKLLGILDEEPEYMNLAQSLGGIGVPYTAAKILTGAMESDFVDESETTLTNLVQMHMIANDFELALQPASKLAEISVTGDGFDTLGYIHYVLHNYDEAADAFSNAIEKGSLGDEADTLLFLARALLELEQFEEAIAAAKRSAEAGDTRAQENAQTYIRFIEGNQARAELIAQRKQDALDFYQDYPPLQ